MAGQTSREEYLLAFQKNLLEALGLRYQAAGRSLVWGYGLAALLVLIDWNSIDELSFMGAKLPVNGSDVFIFVPLLLAGVFVLGAYQLIGIAGINRALVKNSSSIEMVNIDARPVQLDDLRHFERGIPGLIVSLARWQARRVTRKSPLSSVVALFRAESAKETGAAVLGVIRTVIAWTAGLGFRLVLLIGLFVAPVLVGCSYVHDHFFGGGWDLRNPLFLLSREGLPSLTLGALVSVAILTAVAGLVLFSSYLLDSIKQFWGDAASKAGSPIWAVVIESTLKALLPMR